MRFIRAAALALLASLGVMAGTLAPAALAQTAEDVAWANVKTCADLLLFVRTYPAGRHRQEADQRLVFSCQTNSPAPVFPPDPSGGSAASAPPAYPAPQPQFERPGAIAGGAASSDQHAATASPRPPPTVAPRPSAAMPAPASSGSVALPAGYEIVSHVLTPTESYLPKRDGMPTGVVLLDVREKAKNQSLCKALLGAQTATVRTDVAARRANPNGDFLVTNWPVSGVVGNQGDCIDLLAKYDFDRAARIKNAYAIGGSRGPVFLALDPTGEIVFLDLKDASVDAVFKATSDWMKLALASPQNLPAAQARVGLVAGTNRLFAELASGFASLVGADARTPAVVKFNDPVRGTSRQFNIYKVGGYLIGATFSL